ncbi:MAG: ATP-binding cassette domain-containing protein, partial [Boseongicola sp. SB0673_bin_14]|nr:ATP-binding cassette domain-containing protein [Boseongicola sp. SB0673_bin_14]
MIDVRNLSVEFGHPDRPVRAVRDASMKIERGMIHGLIGESGCGKSTIGMAFLGLLPDDARVIASRCRFGETDLIADAARLRGRRISLISQDPAAALNPV